MGWDRPASGGDALGSQLWGADRLESHLSYPMLAVMAGCHHGSDGQLRLDGVTTRFVQNCTLRPDAFDHPLSVRVSDAAYL